jgi:hypothetical protein
MADGVCEICGSAGASVQMLMCENFDECGGARHHFCLSGRSLALRIGEATSTFELFCSYCQEKKDREWLVRV